VTSIVNSPPLDIVPEKKELGPVSAWQGDPNIDSVTEWSEATHLNVTNSPTLAIIVSGENLRPPWPTDTVCTTGAAACTKLENAAAAAARVVGLLNNMAGDVYWI
jgi:hypothetical protein